MLFQTPAFAVFLVVVIALVSMARTNDARKVILLAGSYFFYMWWNPLYVLPLLVTTFIDYFVGQMLEDEQSPAKRLLLLSFSITANLGLLAYFKYFGFFAANLSAAARAIGLDFTAPLLQVVLPVGISFYTFHTMSYTIDVYRREITACRSARDFALFITFFPVLVAGPILRARFFLPQLRSDSPDHPSNKGIRVRLDRGVVLLFARGLVKKVAVADNLAGFVDRIFREPAQWPSVVIWTATLAFAIQIYCDFSGYSDMARALARLFGLEIPLNFDRPYFATSPSEFWRRWHISLSSWLRDYLYIPLGGNRGSGWKVARNLLITMLLGGLWHGASWNFVLWGFLHGFLLTVQHGWRRLSRPSWLAFIPPGLRRMASWVAMQYAVLLTWIVFRIRDFGLMTIALRKFVLFDFNFGLAHIGLATIFFATTWVLIAAFLTLHAFSHRWGDLDERIARLPLPAAAAICLLIGFALMLLWPSAAQPFIYFQF
jgi:alginate O-acetyltransferase complex protein AlgI